MDVMNSADLRNNLAEVLEVVAKTHKPVMVGRFGQPKAVLVDLFTYNWQKQVINLLKRIDKLTTSEIETLNILLNDHTRKMLFAGLAEAKTGNVISLSEFLKD